MPDSDVSMSWWSTRTAGCLAAAEGDTEAATALLHAVIAEARDQGKLLEGLWAQLDLGNELIAVDPSAATIVLREAGREAEQMGAVTQQRLADQSLRRLGVRTWRRGAQSTGPEALDVLSEKEREIARLVAKGASNPEIAEELFVSRKTVERHVSNILAKLGIRNRAELAAAMGTSADAGDE